MNTLLVFALCGAVGALIYSFPVFIAGISKVPPTQFGKMTLVFSVFVGGAFACILTRTIGFHWPWTIEPEPWPLALVIGLCSNPLVPVIIKRLQNRVEAFEGIKS